MFAQISAVALLVVVPSTVFAQSPRPVQQASGPIIMSAGGSFLVDDANFMAPKGHVYKAVFEINVGGDTVRVNEQLTTLARFYNVHGRHGIPEKKLHAAAVVHGSGSLSLLNDAAFSARIGAKVNPSRAMIEELIQHGAQIVLCGQTAGARNIRRDELIPGVQLAMSAMQALNVFQAQGYQFNPW